MASEPAMAQGSEQDEDRHFSSPMFSEVIFAHLICPLAIAITLYVVHNSYSADLISEPGFTLRILWVFQSPIVLLVYSRLRLDPQNCSFISAAGRGALILPLGALANGFGAVALGAPIGIQFLWKTLHWSCFLSSLTFLPAACAIGLSWKQWRCILAWEKTNLVVDNLIRIPAHGAIIGAWLGAWPMPLDWERPWQEWPICVTYGAIAGYVAASLVAFAITVLSRRQHYKQE